MVCRNLAVRKLGRKIASAATAALTLAGAAHAEGAWEFKEVQDQFTDERHHVASVFNASAFDIMASPSEKVRASFECRDGKDFVFALYGGKRLGARDELVKVRYRVDDKNSKTIRLRTFTTSETGGLNKFNAIDMANDILNAKRLRIRMISDNGDQYDAEFSLENADQPILKTVEACGLYVKD